MNNYNRYQGSLLVPLAQQLSLLHTAASAVLAFVVLLTSVIVQLHDVLATGFKETHAALPDLQPTAGRSINPTQPNHTYSSLHNADQQHAQALQPSPQPCRSASSHCSMTPGLHTPIFVLDQLNICSGSWLQMADGISDNSWPTLMTAPLSASCIPQSLTCCNLCKFQLQLCNRMK